MSNNIFTSYNENIHVDFKEDFNSLIILISNIITLLNPREEMVIRSRFLYYNGKQETYKEIGERLQLSAERIRQIQNKALRKLKYYLSEKSILEKLSNELIKNKVEFRIKDLNIVFNRWNREFTVKKEKPKKTINAINNAINIEKIKYTKTKKDVLHIKLDKDLKPLQRCIICLEKYPVYECYKHNRDELSKYFLRVFYIQKFMCDNVDCFYCQNGFCEFDFNKYNRLYCGSQKCQKIYESFLEEGGPLDIRSKYYNMPYELKGLYCITQYLKKEAKQKEVYYGK